MKFEPTEQFYTSISDADEKLFKDGYLIFNGVRVETRPGHCTISLCHNWVPLAKAEGTWDVGDVIDVTIHDGQMKVEIET